MLIAFVIISRPPDFIVLDELIPSELSTCFFNQVTRRERKKRRN